jgi:glycosyltransferase involved in cell wall biosynthesis
VSAARNIGLRAATTRWVAFLDDDDYWTPRKLATQMRALTAEPQRRWVMSGTVAVTEDGKFVGLSLPSTIADDHYRDILAHPPPVAMSDLIVDRQLAIAVGGFRTDLAHWEDWDFTIRYAELAAAPVTVRESLSVYWVRKAAATSDIRALMASLDEFIDIHAQRRVEANVELDRNELDYYLAYRATRFPDTSSFATSLYRSLLRRTRRPQFAVYFVLSRFTPRVFGRLTEWDKVRRLARNERREVSRIVEEARSSPYASVRGERDSAPRGHLEP